MTEALIHSLTPDSLRELMQSAGYRAESFADQIGVPHLRSATNGLPFTVRFGNRLADKTDAYADVTWAAALKIQGELSLDIVNQWNNGRRFCRLHVTQGFLLLEMDVSVLGGVTPQHVRAQIEIWDRLVQELLHYLRSSADKLAAASGSGQSAAADKPEAASFSKKGPAASPTLN
jgi:hypothetical protein